MSAEETRKDADQQALAQLASIEELVAALEKAEAEGDQEEDALDVTVRSDWYHPNEPMVGPTEYCILLCAGGPAVRIVGDLGDFNQPATAELQSQGWFIPWKTVEVQAGARETLLKYASCFYFGG